MVKENQALMVGREIERNIGSVGHGRETRDYQSNGETAVTPECFFVPIIQISELHGGCQVNGPKVANFFDR